MSAQGFNFIQRPKGRTPVRKNPPFQASQGNFNSLFGITGQGVGIRRNNKFMNADYYNQVILPKNPDWQRTVNRDWDNDGKMILSFMILKVILNISMVIHCIRFLKVITDIKII